MRAAPWSLVLLLAGCPYTIPDGRLVCASTADCPPGFVCSGGTCDRGESDRDAGVLDASASDGGASDAPIDAGLPDEVCTPSADGSRASDEDADGAIDEGCAIEIGVPHWMTDALRSGSSVSAPQLSSDGSRLYLCTGGAPHVATRPSTSARFAPPTAVDGVWDEGTGTRIVIDAFAISPDGLEALLQPKLSDVQVSRYVRASAGAPFTFAEVVVEGMSSPSWSPDGLSMVALFGGSVVTHHRASLGAAFDNESTQLLPPPTLGAYLSVSFIDRDALLVVVQTDATTTARIARRMGEDDVFVLEETLDLAGDVESAMYSPATREIFFTSRRDWTPLNMQTAIWRAEVCRDGECPLRQVDCETEDGALRSDDRTHCYRIEAALATWPGAQTACGTSRDAHALTLHSLAELNRADELGDSLYWAAGDLDPTPTWSSGEAWTGSPSVLPTGGASCVAFSGATGGLREANCADQYERICETELWPTW